MNVHKLVRQLQELEDDDGNRAYITISLVRGKLAVGYKFLFDNYEYGEVGLIGGVTQESLLETIADVANKAVKAKEKAKHL